jgi:hypothetical protein
MHHDYYSYIGSSSKDNWLRILDKEVQARSTYTDEKTFEWEAIPTTLKSNHNLCVRVLSEDTSINELPNFISVAPDIVYLDMPLRFVNHLTVDSIPITVKTLGLFGDNVIKMAPDIQFPQIERLMIGYGELIFSNHNFPNLRHLEFKVDRKKIMLGRLPSFEKLEVLSLHPTPKDIFSFLSKLKIKYLRLNNGLLENLNGIEQLEDVTDLWIQALTRLSDLTPLKNLPYLEDLTIAYCKRISIVEPLLEIKNLKRLFVWGCKSKAISSVATLLKNKLNELSIS